MTPVRPAAKGRDQKFSDVALPVSALAMSIWAWAVVVFGKPLGWPLKT